MGQYEITSIVKEGRFYEISSVYGTPTCSDQTYLLPIRDKEIGDSLAVRHGFKQLEDLVRMNFTSHYDCFDQAMEFLLFGRYVNLADTEWPLINLVLPSLINNTNPDIRGINTQVMRNYVDHEFTLGNMVEVEGSYQYNGTKWIDKLNGLLIKHNIRALLCDKLPNERVKGHGFYFIVDYGNRRSKYVFTASYNIINRLE